MAPLVSPFALVIGLMAISLCATLAATYLLVEASTTEDDAQLVASYRIKALVAGAITAVLGALGLFLSRSDAPGIWNGMLSHALPVVIATMIIGVATAIVLFNRHYRLARLLMIGETAFLLGSWGLSQYPYIIPPRYTIANSANEPTVIIVLLIAILIGMLILIPSLYFLFSVFKLPYPIPGLRHKEQQRQTQARHNGETAVR
jgi:cytochrome d ubiquinol oxidase subunit II